MNRFSYGGQAVVEGVVMKGKHYLTMAIRCSDNDVRVRRDPFRSWSHRFPLLRRPLVRGVVILMETLALGVRCLARSAAEQEAHKPDEDRVFWKTLSVSSAGTIAGVLSLFVLPAVVVSLLESLFAANLTLNAAEGIIRLGLYLAYLAVISTLPGTRRMFQYHGAEHQVINCHEAGECLTLDNVRKYPLIHARCGTNFLFVLIVVGVVLFGVLGRPLFFERVLLHLAITPLVAGIAFEVIRGLGRMESPLLRLACLPGMALQYFTTRPPQDDQLEVAIRALETVVQEDAAHHEEQKVKPFPVPVS